MKNLLLILFVAALAPAGFGQMPDVIDLSKFAINGITSESTVEELLRSFGEADSIFDPKHECGPLSPDWNDVEVLMYRFGQDTYHLVNGKLEFDEIHPDENSTIKYKGINLSGTGVEKELMKLFPQSYAHWLKNKNQQLVLWPCENCDSEIWIWIKDDRIERIKYHNPC